MPETAPTTAATQPTTETLVQQATTGTEPVEYSMTFADGKVYKDTDAGKLMKAAEQKFNALYPHTKQVESENALLRQQVGQKPTNQNTFDPNNYYTIWAQDPMKAEEYRRQYDPTFQQAYQKIQQQEWATQSNIFLEKHPEFKKSDENVAKLADAIDALYPGQTEPLKATQIEAAHLYAVSNKFYTVETVGDAVTEKPKTNPAPPAGGSAPQTQGMMDETAFSKLSKDEQRKYLEAEFAKGAR